MTSALEAWLPKSILLLRDYDRHKFVSDLIAGVTVGLVALPLAMAFAIASGVPPQAGLYCAIVTGFLISALGGSKTQIGGPTGAFVVVVAGIIAKHGIDGLFMCTMMAGVLLVLLGITGMGAMVKYFPRPVVVGFTNGIAILIASTQIRDFFGLKMDHVPGDFFHRDRKSTRLNSSHGYISYAVFCLKKKHHQRPGRLQQQRVERLGVLQRPVLQGVERADAGNGEQYHDAEPAADCGPVAYQLLPGQG